MKIPVQTFTVTAEEAGQKLLQYLARRLGRDVPPAALQRFIRTGQVRVDGKRAKPFNRLAMGQLVRVPPYEPGGPGPGTPRPPGASPPETVPALDILHEDADLLVLVKPAGLPVHPGSGHATALTTILHARDPGAPFKPTPAHRLDRDTTGILLVAKSYRATDSWTQVPTMTEDAFTRLQDIMEGAGELAKRVELSQLVDNSFGEKAIKALGK